MIAGGQTALVQENHWPSDVGRWGIHSGICSPPYPWARLCGHYNSSVAQVANQRLEAGGEKRNMSQSSQHDFIVMRHTEAIRFEFWALCASCTLCTSVTS